MLNSLQAALAEHYRIDRELGRGGMATVYLAQDLRHGRSVAIKVLRPELALALGPERFVREIRLAARLQHPNILPVFDSGDAKGQLWYAMPYVEGESLRERLRRETQLPVEEALRVTHEVADALHYAHGQGLLHRDIKPENILLSQGHALISDFGIAQVAEAEGDERLTETGLVMGTPAYMSPEQAAGERHLDRRADLYSLAVLLYEMLVGEPPYTGPTAQVMNVKRLSGQVRPVRRIRPTVPEAVEAAITKALAPVPADRFATVAAFTAALTPAAISRAPPEPSSHRRRAFLPLTLIAVALIAASGILLSRRAQGGGVAADGTAPKRLAVLPFQNLSDSADAYFAEGITDEIRGKLASVPGLEVVARASSERYQAGSSGSPGEIGRELNVEYLLTGTIRWAKGGGTSRVRVSPELIRTGTGATTWQEPFEAALTDVFEVQTDIANQVAQALDQALGDSARRALAERPTEDLTAYTFYLRGRHEWNTRKNEGLRKAVHYFLQAIERDSGYARAYAGLADAYLSLADYHFMPGAEAIPRAQAAAQRALELNPRLAEAHTSLGGILESGWEWQAAEREYRKAIALNPNYPTAHHWLALLLIKFPNRSEETLREIRRALALDPLSLPINSGLAEVLYLTGSYDQAIAQSQRALELETDFPWALEILGLANAAKGKYAEAIQSLNAALRGVPENPQLLVDLAYVYRIAGRPKEARAILPRLAAPKHSAPTPEYVGMGYAAVGEVDSALYWLQRSGRNARSSGFQADDPRLASLKADPRYRTLLKSMGLE